MRDTPKTFSQHPLAILGAAFAFGIVLENFVPLSGTSLVLFAVAFGVATLCFRSTSIASVLAISGFVFLGAFCLSVERSSVRDDRVRVLIDSGVIQSGDPVELIGTLTANEPMSEGASARVAVNQITYRGNTIPASGDVRVFVPLGDAAAVAEYNSLDLRYGTNASVACNLLREDEFLNPGVVPRREVLDRQGIDATALLKSPLLIEKLSDGTRFSVVDLVYRSRQWLLDQINGTFTPSTSGVLAASMLGDKYYLDKATAEAFREGGTFHVLVISGLHITFLGGILLLLARTLTRKRLVQFILVSGSLWTYAVAVGAGVPVVRACLMFTIMLLGNAIYRRNSLLNSLGAGVIVLLVWRPSDAFDPSFQLTVVSVMSIVAVAFPLIEKLRSIGSWMPTATTPFPPNVPDSLRRFCEMLYWRPASWSIETSRQIWTGNISKRPYMPALVSNAGQKIFARVIEAVVVSLTVQMWLLPLLVIYFHRVAPVSVLMNLWVGAAMAVESFAALTGVALAQFSSFLSAPFVMAAEACNWLIVTAPSAVVDSNWASWRVPNYSGWMSVIYVVYFVPIFALAAVLWRWDPFLITKHEFRILGYGVKQKNAFLGSLTGALLFAAFIIGHPFSAPRPDGRLHIDHLDVGQGDSALITFPDGTTMLVDGGGRPSFRKSDDEEPDNDLTPDSPGVGEAVVSPVLWQKGYANIDYILATHADADHIQGLDDVAKNFKVGRALFGRMPANSGEFAQLASILVRRGVDAEFVYRGETLTFGGATVEVLYPRVDTSEVAPSDNNHSVVLRIVYGNRAFLLTGDIEKEAEAELVNGGGVLRSDVIKVPHHGSRTSSTEEFVEAVKPQYAVISVGRHSRFGHPNGEVVDRWLSSGAEVMTTGERGMISISTDGHDLTVDRFVSPGVSRVPLSQPIDESWR